MKTAILYISLALTIIGCSKDVLDPCEISPYCGTLYAGPGSGTQYGNTATVDSLSAIAGTNVTNLYNHGVRHNHCLGGEEIRLLAAFTYPNYDSIFLFYPNGTNIGVPYSDFVIGDYAVTHYSIVINQQWYCK